MARDKSSGDKSCSASNSPAQCENRDKRAGDSAGGRHLPSSAAVRELIEAVAIAFVLAFLFRTFEAEAFVIPTGSMAPTLMGRHKDLICPKCQYPYQASASDEVTQDGVEKGHDFRAETFTCPMCRYTATLQETNEKRSFSGDRILVSKLAYEIADPQRWDVIVFKYPGDPPGSVRPEARNDSRTNFIKRLIGVPGDTVRIQDGDIWIKSGQDKETLGDKAEFMIARKPPRKILAMLQPVFDNDYMPQIAQDGWPARWSPVAGDAIGNWRSDDAATFAIDGSQKTEKWIRYHHIVPPDDWQRDGGRQPFNSKPQLITDFTAYGTSKTWLEADSMPLGPKHCGIGTHWVGDLAVECLAETQNPSGELVLELCKGSPRFQCRFDLSSGQATLSIVGKPDWRRTASTGVRGQGSHKLLFSNCDRELRLWVDGDLISFDGPTTYSDLADRTPQKSDFEPVGIAAAGAAVRLSHIRVLRDIYYIAANSSDWSAQTSHDIYYEIGFAEPDKGRTPSFDKRYVDFDLKKDRLNPQEDQFFVLGDNSSMSHDGRFWGRNDKGYWVPRKLLIGKALVIYWPHSWDRLPYFNGVPCPYFPNFSRMGIVR